MLVGSSVVGGGWQCRGLLQSLSAGAARANQHVSPAHAAGPARVARPLYIAMPLEMYIICSMHASAWGFGLCSER